MQRLYDSRGTHIANLINGHLYAPSGPNVGHFVENVGIFVDMSGRYLGEIYMQNRLLRLRSSSYKCSNFGAQGNYGSAGNYGSPGNAGAIGMPGGYEDVEL